MNPTTQRNFIQMRAAGGTAGLALNPLLARLKFPCRSGDMDDWSVHPNGDLNLNDEIRAKISLNVEKRWDFAESVRLETLTPYPFGKGVPSRGKREMMEGLQS